MKMTDFSTILKQMEDLYKKKNSDYGNSFDDTCDKFGLVAALVRMYDKLNRLSTIVDKNSTEVNESLEDTLMDLANYAVLALLYCKNKTTSHDTNKKQHNSSKRV